MNYRARIKAQVKDETRFETVAEFRDKGSQLIRIGWYCALATIPVALMGLLILMQLTGTLAFWVALCEVLFFAALLFRGLGKIAEGRSKFEAAYTKFYSYRLLPEWERLHREMSELRQWIPKRKVFRKAEDLRALQERFLNSLHREFRQLKEKQKLRKWARENERLWADYLKGLKAYPFSDKLLQEFRAEWDRRSPNPKRRRKYADKVLRSIAFKVFQARYPRQNCVAITAPVMTTPAVEEDLRLRVLEAQASACETEQGRKLYHQAQGETDRRTKIRLYKLAVRADEPKDEEAETAPAPDTSERVLAEARVLDLTDLASETLDLTGLMPAEIDPVAAKLVVLALTGLGNSYRIWPDRTKIMRRVKPRYELETGKPFDPGTLTVTLAWLLRIGAFTLEPMKVGKVYTLPRNTKSAKTEEAKEIIRRAMSLKDELKRGKSW